MPRTVLEIGGQDVGASKAITDVTGAVAKAAIALEGLNIVSSAMLGLAKSSVAAYADSEQALTKLQAQVGNNTSSYQEFAANIQKITTVEDDQVIAAQALAASMGMSSDMLNDAAKSAIGLSSAFGIDLESAMRMVVQANEGQYTMLGRYIPSLKDATTNTQKLAIMNETAARGFEYAKDKANTLSGQLEVNANLMGDLQEELGKTILQLAEPFVGAINEVVKWFLQLDEGTKEFITTVGVVAGASITAAVAIAGIGTAIKALTVAMAGNPFGLILLAVATATTSVVAMVNAMKDANKELRNMTAEELSNKYSKLSNQYDTMAKQNGLMTKDVKVLNNALKEQQDILATSKDFGERDTADLRIDGIKAQIEWLGKLKEVETQKAERDKATKTGTGTSKKPYDDMREFIFEYEMKILEQDDKKTEALIKNRDKELEKAQGNAKAEFLIRQYYDKEIERERQKSISTNLGYAQGYYGALNTLISGMYQNEIDGAEEGSERKKQLQREAFAANKALSIGNILLSTAQAIASALVPFNPISSPILAGIAGAMGAAQLAVAASTPMPAFAEGGIVGGSSYNGDKVAVRVNSGEGIFTKEQMSALGGLSGVNIYGDIHLYAKDVGDMAKQLRSLRRAEAARA